MTGYVLEITDFWRLSFEDKTFQIKAPRARALITFLALTTGGMRSREYLAQLLWPDVPATNARASLRQLMLVLKQDLQDADLLQQSRNDISLDQSRISTDVDVLIGRLEGGEHNEHTLAQVGALPRALADLEDISEDLSVWLRAQRERIVARVATCLQTQYSDRALPARMRNRLAKAAQDLDPFDEDAVRVVMASHTELNNSVAALRVYGDFFEMLDRELGAEPSVETQDLAVSIKLAKDKNPVSVMPAVSDEVSVAVLPFDAAGTDLPEHIIIGLLDHVTCQLAGLRAPAVISSNSTRRFLRQHPEPREIGRVLQATYAVTGAIRTDGEKAVISVQLAKTSDNRVVWANRHVCALDDLYDVNIPIAAEIVQVVSPSINSAELTRTVATPLTELEPYHLLLRAKDLIFQLSWPEFERAGVLLKHATTQSPYFAPAHALMAEWFAIAIWQGWSRTPQDDQVALEGHLQKAISLSPGDGRALALWGHSQLVMHRRYGKAEQAFETALELGPNDAETLIWTVPNFAFLGQPERGVAIGEKAMKLSPLDPFVFRNEHFLSVACYGIGDFERAAALGQSSYERVPNYASNMRTTIAALVAVGRLNDARYLASQHAEVEQGFSVSEFFKRAAFRSEDTRRQFCDRLLSAGMPLDAALTQD
ncbi:BTAD domain-containing putative transcriptional regulator [Ascidiaceihabitans sp.]|uniref:BTAD domain-containing putative transcriptional regulator n=1 Tax=Ascidiaceihabitans sp. TaxID=1872644 RepID=UPI0032973638